MVQYSKIKNKTYRFWRIDNYFIVMAELSVRDVKLLARTISLVESEAAGYEDILKQLPPSATPIIGITGPPGAGKSTMTDALIGCLVAEGKKVAIVCVDPSSPFSYGALLGDRIRMREWYNHPDVFIRSLATRGSLGGLHPKILEITDALKSAPFDYIIVETVGVGQSEVEIAGLADITIVVVVPESGDDIQMMKAGLLEIADIFVVNKSDRPDAERLVQNLKAITGSKSKAAHLPVLKTVASEKQGISELLKVIKEVIVSKDSQTLKIEKLVIKAWHLIQQNRMKDINNDKLREKIKTEYENNGQFNLYDFVYQKRYE